MTGESLQAWMDHLRGGHQTSERLDLLFEDCALEVRSNSRRLLEKLAYYYKDFLGHGSQEPEIRITALEAPAPALPLEFTLKPPDPGKHKRKEEWVDLPDGRIVRKRLTGMLFLFGGGRHLAVGPCVENDNQVINFINNRFIERTLDQGYLLGHAAAVLRGTRGMALAGLSGRGKSTLALHIMDRGATFVSNDRLMIRRQEDRLRMVGVPKLPRINPGTVLNNPSLRSVMPAAERRALQGLSPDALWSLEQKYDCFIDQCFGPGRFRLAGPMEALVLLNWEPNDAPLVVRRVSLRQREDLLPAFMKSVGLFYESADGFQTPEIPPALYQEALDVAEVFEFSGGADFERAADQCLAYLRSGEMPGSTGLKPVASPNP